MRQRRVAQVRVDQHLAVVRREDHERVSAEAVPLQSLELCISVVGERVEFQDVQKVASEFRVSCLCRLD